MAIETTALRRNLTRLETMVYCIIIIVLFVLFMRRMAAVEASAEKAILLSRYQDMQSRLMTLRAGLLQQGGHAGALRLDDLVRKIGWGEIQFVEIGETLDWDTVPPGAWVYFKAARQLQYHVISADYFEVEAAVPKRVRFQIEPRYADINGNGRYDEPGDRLEGAAVQLLDPRALLDSE